MIVVISLIASSKTPCVEGYVIIKPAKESFKAIAFSLNSSTFTFPFSSQPVNTISNPAITAEAGFVPCAEVGIIILLRFISPLDSWYALITINPAYSP